MAEMVTNCPRCGAKEITFDVPQAVYQYSEYSWQKHFEAFCQCRRCRKTTIFLLAMKAASNDSLFSNGFPINYKPALNNIVEVKGFISLKDDAAEVPPEYLPPVIESVFREAATCLAVGCWNAAGTMFRTTIDLATRPLLPDETFPESPNRKVRRDLGLRLPWLFDNKFLPEDLRDLSTSIREDGNDGAHEGTLGKVDAEDIRDFTRALLERLFSYPERVRLAEQRRKERRARSDG